MADDDLLLRIDIKDTLNEVLGRLEDFAADQLPWAQALALYDVGFDARNAMRRELPRKFTIRSGSKPWAERALYVHPKRPSDIKADIISGKGGYITVATESNLGRLLTDGGTKQHKGAQTRDGERTSGEFGIPILGGGRKTAMTQIKPGRNDPAALLKKGHAIIITAKDGRRILVKTPKRYKKGVPKTEQHKAMFHMRPFVTIKPWWNLREILANTMTIWLPQRFEAACQKAMATRKPG